MHAANAVVTIERQEGKWGGRRMGGSTPAVGGDDDPDEPFLEGGGALSARACVCAGACAGVCYVCLRRNLPLI